VAEVFDHFVVSVIERLSATGGVSSSLPPPARPRATGSPKSKLLVVCDAVHASGVPRIGFWVGAFGARHDMRCGSTAVEVKTTRLHTGHRVTIHGEDKLLAPEQGVSVRLGVRVRKNDLGSRPTQRAAFPKAFVDVLDGDLIHEGNGRDQAVVP
jgi:Putative  PD-(D/E)XK family member, (DUF4420)